jgi:CRP-like cAMP-binding protein
MDWFKQYLQENFKLSEEDWHLAKPFISEVDVKKNNYFLKEGKICRKMGFVKEGVMRYHMINDAGNDITCYFVSENDFVGDPTSFVNQAPSTFNLQALTDCHLITLSFEAIKELKGRASLHLVAAAIGHRTTTSLLDQRSQLMNKDSATRYRDFVNQYPHILQRAPLSCVATFLDITPQSLSRLRKQFS